MFNDLCRILLVMVFVSSAHAANIVCLAVDDPDNYQAISFLNDFSEQELRSEGHRVTIVQGNHPKPTDFPGLTEVIPDAELLVVFVRRATPPTQQLDAIKRHLHSGKPLLGIRTANHAFAPLPSDTVPDGRSAWPEFVPEVLGCQNSGYETNGMPYQVALHPEAQRDTQLLKGIDLNGLKGHTSLYRVLPTAEDVQPLLLGTARDVQPAQPLAWTRRFGPAKAKIFYTSLGDPLDVKQPAVRRLLLNAVEWALSP
jgi:hypothetical protein